MRVDLALTAFALLALCDHKEHPGGLQLVPGKEQGDTHIDSERSKYPPERVRVHVPLGIDIIPPLDYHNRPGHRVCKRLCLPEKIAVDEGVDKVPGGLALDEDTVADRVITLRQAFEPDRSPHPGQFLDNFRGGLAIVDTDRRALRSELLDERLIRCSGFRDRDRLPAHLPQVLLHPPLLR